MPRLILFAACSRVIVDAEDETVTLVGLLERVSVLRDAEGRVPTVADVNWQHIAIWQADDGDEDRTYEQRVEVLRPDRRQAAEVRHPLDLSRKMLRVYGAVAGFPSEVEGAYTIRLSSRNALDDETWQKVAEYPVTVRHAPAGALPATPNSGADAPAPSARHSRRAARRRGGSSPTRTQ